ncbi:hypothetical protein VTN96DRAFT_9779 [Rasamsonia emersonii]|uniref:Kinesin-like protein n=1 Tax=Rasamsonia emersonii (strain ATCC 16479 / CBS 393.64 / IMI 116815) TaxID=1408163 RepID=A0A0F4YSA8_RASE3|nr:Kinesin family protein (KipA) [Rasamsonia emersonii CBS 393.64]KKA21119.1 Kinesin family protein (KipA) [Rasamsonia emersonii CBS 393.64]
MASPSALPQPSRHGASTPTGALSSLPAAKPRTLSALSDTQRAVSPSPSQTPSRLRPPSSPRPSAGGTSQSNSTSGIATPRSTSGSVASNASDKTLRRTVSIAAFPQPPKAGARLSTASSISISSTSQLPSTKRSSPDLSKSGSSGGSVKAKKQSRPSSGTTSGQRSSKTPSLLNNNGDGKSIPSGSGPRDSEGQFSIPSPPQSRSSSAQGSYSTSATTFDDPEDADRHGLDAGENAASAKKSAKSKESKGNVIVSVRVRPDTGGSENSKTDGEWLVDGRRALISYRGKESYDYFYDNVFTAHDNNAKVYDASAKRLVRRVMEGYHGTVFAYGMTGTGKTFSMQGTASSPGVIPLAITDIFSYIRETPHREFLLRVSYLEIYNEKIHDLLSTPTSNGGGPAQQEEIKLREDSKRGVYATPLKEEIVQSPTQLLRVIARGDHARRTGSTQFNARSSRSHAVVQIVVESRERAPGGGSSQEKRSGMPPGGVRVSTLSLIDLAGSERAADNKERRQEGAHINKSLLTLGTVIARLSESRDKHGNPTDQGKHLPYRDSKLTRLLQPALSGNSLVSILCTIQIGSSGSSASANTHTNETLNTLKFAARAKNNIVSHAKRAEEAYGGGSGDAGSRVLLERYRMEIQSLRAQLEAQAKAQAENELKLEEQKLEKEAQARHEEQMLEMQLARTALKERIEHLNRLILSSKSTGVNSHAGTSGLERLSRISTESGTRSLRSSASQSTLGATSLRRTVSQMSLNSGDRSSIQYQRASFVHDDDDDTIGEFGDGVASLQMQVAALQADLADKNRYISTLERRLLQARRASQSRISMGLSQLKNGDNSELIALLREKDMEISELRIQLDDKDRMLAALRSAARQRDLAQMTADVLAQEKRAGRRSSGSNTSSPASTAPAGSANPADPQGSEKEEEKKRKSVDEVSRMLDEMIQDRVESGHLIKSSRGSMRVVSDTASQRESLVSTGPGVNTAPSSQRTSIAEAPKDI